MERGLTNLEKRALQLNIGQPEERFLVCALSPLREEYAFIDSFKFCNERDDLPKLKKELKKQFPRDNFRVIVIKVRRIE